MSMRQQGLVKGGTDACAIVGYGDRWYEPQRVRFMDDEPVRHKMLDLIVSAICHLGQHSLITLHDTQLYSLGAVRKLRLGYVFCCRQP